MSLISATRGAQYPLVAEFVFNYNDTIVDTSGSTEDLSAVGTVIANIISLPPGAVVSGGEIVTETAVTGAASYTLSLGDSGSAARYFAATDCKAAGRKVLVPTGYVGAGENLQLTVVVATAAATAGKISVRVQYTVRNRLNEAQPS